MILILIASNLEHRRFVLLRIYQLQTTSFLHLLFALADKADDLVMIIMITSLRKASYDVEKMEINVLIIILLLCRWKSHFPLFYLFKLIIFSNPSCQDGESVNWTCIQG